VRIAGQAHRTAAPAGREPPRDGGRLQRSRRPCRGGVSVAGRAVPVAGRHRSSRYESLPRGPRWL